MDRKDGVDSHTIGQIGAASGDRAELPLHVREDHAAGRITLGRASRLNALTPAMYRAIAQALPGWGRAPLVYCVILDSAVENTFCAGNDFGALLDLAGTDPAEAHRALGDAYALAWQLDCYTKPTISLLDGMVIGAGVGLSLYGTHRVAGERYRFSMPEAAMGWFPDHGVAHVFARMPARIGMYLALTGHSLGRADAFRLGLVTHCVPSSEFAAITASLCDADPVDPLLDGLHVDPGPGELEPWTETIARCFSADTVEGIVARLEQEKGAAQAWAASVAQDLSRLSPLSLKITHRMVREAGTLDLREVLQQDYRIACRRLAASDFSEGARVHSGRGKDGPRWDPATLSEITDTDVDCYFVRLDAGELTLLTRAEMQAVGP